MAFDKEEILEIAESEAFAHLTTEGRMKLLRRMDEALRENINDEEVFELWLTIGLPDMPNDGDIEFTATNPCSFVDCLYAFVKTVLDDWEA